MHQSLHGVTEAAWRSLWDSIIVGMQAYPQAGQLADGAAGLKDDAVELQGLQTGQAAQVHGLASAQAEVVQVQRRHLPACRA